LLTGRQPALPARDAIRIRRAARSSIALAVPVMHIPTNTHNRTHAQLNSGSTPKVGSNRAAFDRLLSNE